jgi:hypothetical protein
LAVKAEPKFRGRNEGLKMHVFDCTDGKQGDQYTVTMKEIAECVGRNYSYGADIRRTLVHYALFVVKRPKKPDDMDEIDTMIFKKEVDEYAKRSEKHGENCRTLFSLILGQCSDYLKAKLRSLPIYSYIKESFDVLCLIKAIKQKLQARREHVSFAGATRREDPAVYPAPRKGRYEHQVPGDLPDPYGGRGAARRGDWS